MALAARVPCGRKPGAGAYYSGRGEHAQGEIQRGRFIRAEALDEITLGVVPVLVGAGRLTFPPEFPETEVELVACKQYKGGVLGLTYRIVYERKEQPRNKKRR